MNKVVSTFLSQLSYGEPNASEPGPKSFGVVETLARAYEKARNALEYRADHLVRRAAIERILKRRILLDKSPKTIATHLLTELRWAKYLSNGELKKEEPLRQILEKYLSLIDQVTVPQDWVIKTASSEIEELFNLNTDYQKFSLFAFQVMNRKVKTADENADLLIFYAVDKAYGGSDDEQIAYHILKLAGENLTKQKLEEGWRLFNLARDHKFLPKIIKFVRRQMPPLILLRDLYFFSPGNFKKSLEREEVFEKSAAETLEIQLKQMSGRLRTAGIRSVLYVFLTKMILAIAIEAPFEIVVYGGVSPLPLVVNLIFPPFLMWLTTLGSRLPSQSERGALITRSWFIVEHFDELETEGDELADTPIEKTSIRYSIFSIFYVLLYIATFALIYFVLSKIGFKFANKVVFVFFLTIIAFFAYRINQIAKVYSWKGLGKESSTFIEIVSLPILAIGSRLSRGLSKLNFLAFTFDFILEAPFKIILGAIDSWVQFLSVKKEEEIIE